MLMEKLSHSLTLSEAMTFFFFVLTQKKTCKAEIHPPDRFIGVQIQNL